MNNNNGHNAPQEAQPAQPSVLEVKYAIAMQQLGTTTDAIFGLQAELELTKRTLNQVTVRNMELEKAAERLIEIEKELKELKAQKPTALKAAKKPMAAEATA